MYVFSPFFSPIGIFRSLFLQSFVLFYSVIRRPFRVSFIVYILYIYPIIIHKKEFRVSDSLEKTFSKRKRLILVLVTEPRSKMCGKEQSFSIMTLQIVPPLPSYWFPSVIFMNWYRISTSFPLNWRLKLIMIETTFNYSCIYFTSFSGVYTIVNDASDAIGFDDMQLYDRRADSSQLCKRLATVNREIVHHVVICSYFAIMFKVWHRSLLIYRSIHCSSLSDYPQNF